MKRRPEAVASAGRTMREEARNRSVHRSTWGFRAFEQQSYAKRAAGLWPVEIRRRPVLELHAERQPSRRQHFLDLVQRFAAQIRCLQKLGLGALDQVADVIDVLRLEAIGGAYRELEIIHRTQQDRIDLRHGALFDRRFGALQVGEDAELLDEDGGRVADRLLGLDDAVGLDVHHQLVEVRALLHARALDRVAYAANRR